MGRCERLKWNRRKLGMTQKELADKIGVGVTTIYKLETDETAWATIRDTTEDAVYSIFRDLGSWQCDVESVFNKNISKSTEEIKEDTEDFNEIRKQLKEKRKALGMYQRDLGKLIGIDKTTVSKYENNDKKWLGGDAIGTIVKLKAFINGEYDDYIISNRQEDIEVSVSNDITDKEIDKVESDKEIEKQSEKDSPAVEETLNDVIDILQEKLSLSTGKDVKRYVSMIVGVCNGYMYSE